MTKRQWETFLRSFIRYDASISSGKFLGIRSNVKPYHKPNRKIFYYLYNSFYIKITFDKNNLFSIRLLFYIDSKTNQFIETKFETKFTEYNKLVKDIMKHPIIYKLQRVPFWYGRGKNFIIEL